MKPVNQGWFGSGGGSMTPVPPPTPSANSLIIGNELFLELDNSVVDSTGNYTPLGINITYNATWASFNGVSSFILAFSGKISNSADGYFSAWVNPNTLGANNAIFGYGGDSASLLFLLGLRDVSGTSFPTIIFRDSAGANLCVIVGDTAVPTGSPVFLEYYTEASAYVMKVNGLTQNISVLAGSNHGRWLDQLSTTNDKTTIGSQYTNATNGFFFDGLINRSGYWTRVPENWERANNYNIGNGNYHPFINSLAYTETSLFTATPTYSRWQTLLPTLLNDGSYLQCVTRFGDNPSDGGSNTCLFYKTTNLLSLTNNVSELTKPDGAISMYCVGMRTRADGTVYAIFLVVIDNANSRLEARTSTDKGTTWSEPTVLKSNAGVYLNAGGAGSIFVTADGTWLFGYSILVGGVSYTGKILRSTDQGANWTTLAANFIPTGNDCLEPVFTQTDTKIIMGVRTADSNSQYMFTDSTDDGLTWSAFYYSGILYNSGQANGMGLIRLPSNGGYVSSANITNRQQTFLSWSATANANTFTYYFKNAIATGFNQVSATPMLIIGDYIYLWSFVSTAANTLYSLNVQKIYIPSLTT